MLQGWFSTWERWGERGKSPFSPEQVIEPFKCFLNGFIKLKYLPSSPLNQLKIKDDVEALKISVEED